MYRKTSFDSQVTAIGSFTFRSRTNWEAQQLRSTSTPILVLVQNQLTHCSFWQVSKDECMAHNDGHELVVLNLHVAVHVRVAERGRMGSSEVLTRASCSGLGHFPLLFVWSSGAKLHLPHNQQVRSPHKHYHHHHPQVRQHFGLLSLERKPSLLAAMGWGGYGLYWTHVPDLSQI